jgi:hypothetical protein
LQILSQVLSYLSFQDLKSTRLVNSSWKEESYKYFLQRARVNFYLGLKLYKTELELQFAKCHKNISLSNFRPLNQYFKFSPIELFNLAVSSGSRIKSLSLALTTTNLRDFKLYFINALSNLPHLEELELTLTLDAKYYLEIDLKPLPLVKTITHALHHQQRKKIRK